MLFARQPGPGPGPQRAQALQAAAPETLSPDRRLQGGGKFALSLR